MIVEYNRDLFTTMGPCHHDLVLQRCPVLVTDEKNQRLIVEITLEEVGKAVFQLGALKAPGPESLNVQFFQLY